MTEKFNGVEFEEYQTRTSTYSSRNGGLSEFTPEEEKKIKRRIDLRLVVLIGFMYCVSLMDRTNLGNAKAAGMALPRIPKYEAKQGLNLTGFRYNIMTLVFFPPYILAQIPSTVIVRKLGPRLHLSTITAVWGGVMVGMAFVQDWGTMAGLRVVLGVLEAGFFPSCVYLLSTWYTRYEMGKRYALFYILGCVASAFAGILAYAIMDLEGRLNLSGWRWIFLIEGFITIFVALVGATLLVGFPDNWSPKWHFLSERECKWVCDKVNADRGDAVAEKFNLGKWARSGTDWKVWCYALIFFNTTTITYALAYFLPDILSNGLKYSPKMTQIMAAPPYIFAGFVMFATGWAGDRYRIRGPIIVFNMILCLIGLPMLGYLKNGTARYIGIFLVTAGANANIPTVMTYQANNIVGQWKRAFCSATLVGFGGIGGIAGSLVFRTKDAPNYYPGLWACMACAGFTILLVAALTFAFLGSNKKVREGKLRIEGTEEGFQYTI